MTLMENHDVDSQMQRAFHLQKPNPCHKVRSHSDAITLLNRLWSPALNWAGPHAQFVLLDQRSCDVSSHRKALESRDRHLCVTLVFTIMSAKKLFNSTENWSFKKDKPSNFSIYLKAFIIKCWGRGGWNKLIFYLLTQYHTVNTMTSERVFCSSWFPALRPIPGPQ